MLTDKQKENALCAAFGDVTIERADDLRFLASVEGYFNTAEGRMPIYAFGRTKEDAVTRIFDAVSMAARERGGKGKPSTTSCVYTEEGKRVIARGDGFRLKDKSAFSPHYKPRR